MLNFLKKRTILNPNNLKNSNSSHYLNLTSTNKIKKSFWGFNLKSFVMEIPIYSHEFKSRNSSMS
jgi:hypothetical protein